jgi:hypothetical protein
MMVGRIRLGPPTFPPNGGLRLSALPAGEVKSDNRSEAEIARGNHRRAATVADE